MCVVAYQGSMAQEVLSIEILGVSSGYEKHKNIENCTIAGNSFKQTTLKLSPNRKGHQL